MDAIRNYNTMAKVSVPLNPVIDRVTFGYQYETLWYLSMNSSLLNLVNSILSAILFNSIKFCSRIITVNSPMCDSLLILFSSIREKDEC